MNAEQRREAILNILRRADQPLSATALAGTFSVSRQIVVGDIALLRAAGADISATPRGYVMQQETTGFLYKVATRHTAENMEAELNAMVDQGCTVVDVIVEHPIYGELTGALDLSSRYDVRQFIQRSMETRPLSLLTEGIHLHTVLCPSQEAFDRVREALGALGVLLED